MIEYKPYINRGMVFSPIQQLIIIPEMRYIMEQYSFSNSSIVLAIEKIKQFLASSSVESREALRILLIAEEILIDYQERFGTDACFKLKCVKRFSSIKVEIIADGEAFDPLSQDEDKAIIRGLLAGIGLAPTWSYKNNKNYIVFIPKKKPLSATVKMVSAAVLSVIVGSILNLLPSTVTEAVNSCFLNPMVESITGLISAIAGPMIFLSVLGSVLSMGNVETLGRIGTRTLKICTLYMAVISLLFTSLGSLFCDITLGGSSTSSFSQVLDLFYDIIPSNLFEAFITGNAMQLIFIAVMVGVSMLILSSRVHGVFSFVEQTSIIVQTIMTGVSSVFPFLIFVMFTGMISSGNLDTLIKSCELIALTLFLYTCFYIGNILRISIQRRISPVLLFKKTLPTLMIALSTGSSAAALSRNVQDASGKLGIDKKLAEFATPVGQVLFMPGLVAFLFSLEISFAANYGIPITIPWLILGMLTNLLISFAIPPIPGGAMLGFSVAFAQLGIPLEAMGIALAANAIIDFPGTACNVSSWQLVLIDVADSLDMLDKEVLHKKNGRKKIIMHQTSL